MRRHRRGHHAGANRDHSDRRPEMRMLLLLIGALLLLAEPASAQRTYLTGPRDFYIASAGSPTTDCSLVAPCTLQRAFDHITNDFDFGGTTCPRVLASPGTYNLTPFVTLTAKVIGCGKLSPFDFSAGPSIDLIGDTSADASGLGHYSLQCSLRCIPQL